MIPRFIQMMSNNTVVHNLAVIKEMFSDREVERLAICDEHVFEDGIFNDFMVYEVHCTFSRNEILPL